MSLLKDRETKIFLAVVLAILLLLAGAGFQQELSAGSRETYEGLKLFSEVIELVEKNYIDQVESKELIEKAITGMIDSLDPHSALLTPEALKDLQVDTQGEFTGIGISITMRDGFITVISPIEGTPAYRAGIKAGDRIIEVDGEPAKDLREAVKMIRGPKGTKVVVTIVREDVPDPIDYEIVRDVIPLESVRSIVLKPGFGYVWITNFRDTTTADLEEALAKLDTENEPLKGLILDLRDNPGGLLSQAISVSDMFLDSGIILSIKGRQERNTKEFEAHSDSTERGYPMVVLINGGSASASEIVAGALQDHRRAIILGTTSFGKGSVQNVEMLREGYGLKLTIARYYTPNGTSIQARGIEPDVVIEERFLEDDTDESNLARRVKESDLENHLEAESEDQKKEGDEDKEKSKPEETRMQHEQLSLDRLKKDNQVMRALEILISHDLFTKMPGPRG